MRLGSLAPPTDAEKSPRAHSGALRFSSTAATVDNQARTRRPTLPRVGGRGGPNAMCGQKSTGPRPAELGQLDQTKRSGGRGVNVKSAQ